MEKKFASSLIWRTLLPVTFVGLSISIVLSHFLIPPIISVISRRADTAIEHTTDMAINICEERFNDIVEQRMEENVAINRYSKTESVKEILKISSIFPNVRVLILTTAGAMEGSSFSHKVGQPRAFLKIVNNDQAADQVTSKVVLGERLRVSHDYFPFWRWHIISFIPENEFLAPLRMTRKYVNYGLFGTLLAVITTISFLFVFQINRPLNKIINATEKLRHGEFQKVGLTGNGEIKRVAIAYDEMVAKLKSEKLRIEQFVSDLSISEARYRKLFEQAAVGVAISNSHTGSFVHVNNKYCNIVGYSKEELYDLTFHDISHPEDVGDDLKNLALLQKGEITEYTLDKRFLKKNGFTVWGRVTISPMWQKGQNPDYHIAILEDITERKSLEKRLSDNHALLEAVVLQSQIPMAIVETSSLKLLYVNSAALEFWGVSNQDFIGKPLKEYNFSSSFYRKGGQRLGEDELPINKALNGIETCNEELQIAQEDGLTKWALVNASPIYNREKEQIAAFVAFADITRMKLAVRATEESEQKFRLVMEACPEPIVVYDMNGHVQYLNVAFTRVFGWLLSELLGRKIPFVPVNAQTETDKMLKLLQRGESYTGFETQRLNKSGKIIEVNISWGVFKDQDGKLGGTVVILRDVTK